jgi:hypothetical protein
MLYCMSPLLALSGHADRISRCPLSGDNRNTYETRKALDTWAHHLEMIIAQASRAKVTRLPKKA